RTKEEVEEVRKKRDPIDRLREELIAKGIADDAKLKDVDREVREIVVRAAEFSQQSPEPDPAELFTDVLA
ncbi:MAG TPA: thiamine pyrophosphate-dependent enzyme, partial [Alphaproteobacteria bacterium]